MYDNGSKGLNGQTVSDPNRGRSESGTTSPIWVAMRQKLKEKAVFLLPGLLIGLGVVFLNSGGRELLDAVFIEHPGQVIFFIVIVGGVVGLLVHEWISEWKMKIEKSVEDIEKKVDAILERMD